MIFKNQIELLESKFDEFYFDYTQTNLTTKQICQKYQIKTYVFFEFLKIKNIPRRKKYFIYNQKYYKDIYDCFINKNYTVHQIAQKYNVASNTIKSFLLKNKIISEKDNLGSIWQRNFEIGYTYDNIEIIDFISISRANGGGYYVCKCLLCKRFMHKRSSEIKKRSNCKCQMKLYQKGKLNPRYKGYDELSGSYWASIKSGAKARNLEFSITPEYGWNLFVKQDKKCILTGLQLYMSSEYKDSEFEQTASLDRINSSKGYVEGNVQWVHKQINIAKQDLSDEEFIKICTLVADYNRNK